MSKVFAHWMTVQYREAHGLFACNGILFNHESPRRGGTFVTRKVTRAVAAILAGTQEKVYLGNLDAKRDWGYAPEYVEAMWRMLQQDEPDDYVIATGEMHTVRELVETAFALVGLDWQAHVGVDPRYYRPTEVDELCGDPSKAADRLGWRPRVRFQELLRVILSHDLREAGLDPERHMDGEAIPPGKGAAGRGAGGRAERGFCWVGGAPGPGGGGFPGSPFPAENRGGGTTEGVVGGGPQDGPRAIDAINRALAASWLGPRFATWCACC